LDDNVSVLSQESALDKASRVRDSPPPSALGPPVEGLLASLQRRLATARLAGRPLTIVEQGLEPAIAALIRTRSLLRVSNGGLRIQDTLQFVEELQSPAGIIVVLPGEWLVRFVYTDKGNIITPIWGHYNGNDRLYPALTQSVFASSRQGFKNFFDMVQYGFASGMPASMALFGGEKCLAGMLSSLTAFQSAFLSAYDAMMAAASSGQPRRDPRSHHVSLHAAASLMLVEFLYTALMPGSQEGFNAVLLTFSAVWDVRIKARTGLHEVNYVAPNGMPKELSRMKLHLSLALGILGWGCPFCGAMGVPSVYCVRCQPGLPHAKSLLASASPAPASVSGTPVTTQEVIAWLAKQSPAVTILPGTRVPTADYNRAKAALQGVRPQGKVSVPLPLAPTEDACLRFLENQQQLLAAPTCVEYEAGRMAGAPAACDAN
jgi:hypothetical protein